MAFFSTSIVNPHHRLIRTDMSLRTSTTTADYLEWDTMLALVRKLYRDGDFRMSLLIGCGAFLGLRISDILTLNWQILQEGRFTLVEKKTGKRRTVKVNPSFARHVLDCHNALGIIDDAEPCFLSRYNTIYSVQYINRRFKEIKRRYAIKIENFSTHSLRKTFGRKVVESSGTDAEMALIRLSELFNHRDVATTRRYLGLRQSELLETYDLLDF